MTKAVYCEPISSLYRYRFLFNTHSDNKHTLSFLYFLPVDTQDPCHALTHALAHCNDLVVSSTAFGGG